MTILTVLLCIIVLVLMITWGKINPFLAFLVVSIVGGLFLGIPFNKITASVQKGIGDTLGTLVIIIVLGAMLGKLVAESGAAQKIATVLMKTFGEKNIQWALMVTGFIVGIPLFYNVGFVLMIPLIFSVVYQYKLPAVYIGLPMLIPNDHVATAKATNITTTGSATKARIVCNELSFAIINGSIVVTISKITGSREVRKLFIAPGNFSAGNSLV